MVRIVLIIIALAAFSSEKALGQAFWPAGSWESLPSDLLGESPQSHRVSSLSIDWLGSDQQGFYQQPDPIDFNSFVVRGQDAGGNSGGGAGAAAATDPSAPLAQLQLQNVLIPESFDSSGYSNQLIIQPVLPFHISEDAFFPFHIMRPTLPIISPTADPDGTAGVEGGLGDTTLLDVFVHPMKEIKTNVGVGYTAILPTATHPQLGSREWKLGPSAFLTTTAIDKWLFGAVYQQPFSFQSNAYQILVQPIIVRHLPNEAYIRWGDLNWVLDDENGNYDLPLNIAIGKVVKVGKQPLNVFAEPFYTPDGLHSGVGGNKWGVKLNVTFLFPDAKLSGPILSRLGCGDRCCH